MSLRRVVPPTAARLSPADLLRGFLGMVRGRRQVQELEEEFKEHFGVRHVFLVSSGKAALTLILLGLKSLLPKRRSVVIPAYTCFSVPAAVNKAGLKVSLCDIDQRSLVASRESFGDAVDPDTLCIVPTHLFGTPSDLDRICALGRERGFFVVEDAAQAMGVSREGRYLGTIGDVGFFSLGRGKNLTCGAGGVIMTNDDDIARAISRQHAALQPAGIARDLNALLQVLLLMIFIRPLLYWLPARLPFLNLGKTIYPEDFPLFPLSGFHAGVLRGWRGRLERDGETRRKNSEYFIRSLPRCEGWQSDIPYLRLAVLVESRAVRDELYAAHRDSGVGIMYPTPISELEQVRQSAVSRAYPSAEAVAERLLTIPTHHLVSERDRRKILQAVEHRLSCPGPRAQGVTPC